MLELSAASGVALFVEDLILLELDILIIIV